MKRLISLLLLVVLVAGLALPAGARSTSNQIAFIDELAFQDYEGNAATRPEQTRPGDEIIIPINPQGLWGADNENIKTWDPADPLRGPTVQQLRANRVVPTLHVIKGENFIRDIELVKYTPTRRNNTRSAVRIRFKDDIDSSQEITYEFSVYLALDGKTTGARETFGGMVRNEIFDVYKRDYVYIGDGEIADASGTCLNLELDIGNGVSIFRDMYAGDRFYGRAEIWGNDDQDAIASTYKEIETVYDLTTINVKFNGTPVYLKDLAESPTVYYVYNREGDLVGTNHDMLPYSTRYYLTRTEIEIDPSLAEIPVYTQDELKMGEALQRFIAGVEEEPVLVD